MFKYFFLVPFESWNIGAVKSRSFSLNDILKHTLLELERLKDCELLDFVDVLCEFDDENKQRIILVSAFPKSFHLSGSFEIPSVWVQKVLFLFLFLFHFIAF